MPSEPSLGQVRDELVTTLNLDARVRGVEIKQASQDASLLNLAGAVNAMREEHRQDKVDIMAAIEAAKPKPWPIVSALAGVAGVLLVVAAVLYGQPPA